MSRLWQTKPVVISWIRFLIKIFLVPTPSVKVAVICCRREKNDHKLNHRLIINLSKDYLSWNVILIIRIELVFVDINYAMYSYKLDPRLVRRPEEIATIST